LGLREENQMNFLEKLKIHTSFYLQKARYDWCIISNGSLYPTNMN
jgi:hypothetical protein